MTNQRKTRLLPLLLVFLYDCNELHAWLRVDPCVCLCLDLFGMQPLLQQPRHQSGLRFETLRFLSSVCVDPVGSSSPGAESIRGHFLDSLYAPSGISFFEKTGCCGKLCNSQAAVVGVLVHFGVWECSTFILLLWYGSISTCLPKHRGLNICIIYFRSRWKSKTVAASPEVI